jgi:hypothetical protein
MQWHQQFKNGILKMADGNVDTAYCCDTYKGNWYASIGQKKIWGSGMPAADCSTVTATELWVRIDRKEAANNLAIVKPNTIACKNYMEI